MSILKSGVPQGSVLGPLFFLIFIGDITEGVTSSTLVYVDDSKTKDNVKNENDVERLQQNLDTIYEWEAKNNMEFNGGKCQVMRYGKNQEIKETTYWRHVTSNKQVNTCKDLARYYNV